MKRKIQQISIAIFFGIATTPSFANAVLVHLTHWQAAVGNWSVGSNWDHGEPLPDSDTDIYAASINNGGTAQITYPNDESCSEVHIGDGTSSSGMIDMSGGNLSVTYEIIGYAGTGTCCQTGGTNAVGQYCSLAKNSGANGTYELSGTGRLSTNQEYIGESGTGVFQQTDGTHIVDDFIHLGHNAGSTGNYTISGGTLVAQEFSVGYTGSGTFTVTGNDSTIMLGNYSQSGASKLVSAFDSDGISVIDVTGNVLLGGIWNIIDLGDAPLGVFDILVADEGLIMGDFDTINLPNDDWNWGLTDTSGTDTLWVQHVPEPATMLMMLLGGFGLLRRRKFN